MGADKALLPFGDSTLIEQIASRMQLVCPNVTLVGESRRNLPAIPDLYPGEGPLGGIVTALQSSKAATWNLVLACDLPSANSRFLNHIVEEAFGTAADCVVPTSQGREHPLCAAYHRRALEPLHRAFQAGERKLTHALRSLRVQHIAVPTPELLANANTPEDWQAFQQGSPLVR